jgi:hypothetical protein
VKSLRAFARLTRQEWPLVFEAYVTLVVCRVRLWVQSIDKLQVWATRAGGSTIAVDRLARAIEVASRNMPRATCLCRALALQRLLAKNGHVSELRIGVEKSDDRFGAHAWLVQGGEVLIGASQLEKYKLLASWPSKSEVSESRWKGKISL